MLTVVTMLTEELILIEILIFSLGIRGFQQRRPRGFDYASKEEDNFRPMANNWGINVQEFNMKMDLPSFDCRLNIEDFLD